MRRICGVLISCISLIHIWRIIHYRLIWTTVWRSLVSLCSILLSLISRVRSTICGSIWSRSLIVYNDRIISQEDISLDIPCIVASAHVNSWPCHVCLISILCSCSICQILWVIINRLLNGWFLILLLLLLLLDDLLSSIERWVSATDDLADSPTAGWSVCGCCGCVGWETDYTIRLNS